MKWLLVIATLCSTACVGRTDPDALRVKSNCRRSLVGDECVIEGGIYGPGGFSSVPFCNCPAEDAGKPCDSPFDCTSMMCVGEGRPFSCDGVEEGVCADYQANFGCFCAFGLDGTTGEICVD